MILEEGKPIVKCQHMDFEKMCDEEMRTFYHKVWTEASGTMDAFMCEECWKPLNNPKNQTSVEGTVKK